MYDGVPGELLLTWLPTYGPLATGASISGHAGEPEGAVFFASEQVRLPVTVTRMR
jgi:hypothetical protein